MGKIVNEKKLGTTMPSCEEPSFLSVGSSGLEFSTFHKIIFLLDYEIYLADLSNLRYLFYQFSIRGIIRPKILRYVFCFLQNWQKCIMFVN